MTLEELDRVISDLRELGKNDEQIIRAFIHLKEVSKITSDQLDGIISYMGYRLDRNLNIIRKEVKQISITSISEDALCEENLTITFDTISFSQMSYRKNKYIDGWKYENIKGLNSFPHLCEYAEKVVKLNNKELCDEDISFKIELTYNDGSHSKIEKKGTFSDNGLSEFALELMKFTKVDEEKKINDVIKPFKKKRLTKQSLLSLPKDKICGFFISGDAGRMGEIDILTADYERYTTIGEYNDEEKFNINSEDYLGNGENKQSLLVPYMVKLNNETWIVMYLGFGNFLSLRDDLFHKIGNIVNAGEFDEKMERYNILIG